MSYNVQEDKLLKNICCDQFRTFACKRKYIQFTVGYIFIDDIGIFFYFQIILTDTKNLHITVY